jgi:hypothetical protein
MLEAEIRRTVDPGQSCRKVSEIPSQSVVGHDDIHLSSKTRWEAEIRKLGFQASLSKKKFANPYLNKKKPNMVMHTYHSSSSGMYGPS